MKTHGQAMKKCLLLKHWMAQSDQMIYQKVSLHFPSYFTSQSIVVIYNVSLRLREIRSSVAIFRNSGGEGVRALAFHQCGLGSISRFGVIFGLSLLVVCSERFSRGYSGGAYHLHGKPGNSGWKMKWYIPLHLRHFRNYRLST